jgi:aspartyl protease family protein
MKKEDSGVYTVPCEVNGLRLRFVLDTGASSVSISLTEANFMLKNGYLNEDDIKGTTNIQTADGKIHENYLINLKKIKIGTFTLENVQAVVSD